MKKIKFDDEIARDFKGEKVEKYIYRVDDADELVEVSMSYGEMLQREGPGGILEIQENIFARRCLQEEFVRDGITTRDKSQLRTRAKWPMKSTFGGVNPNQRKELSDFWAARGITGCSVDKEGDIIYEDRASRRRDHEARGLFDRAGGYGDAMPKNL